jgi:hypothetical protein
MPCPSDDHLVEILNELYHNREELDRVAQACYERATDEQFAWDTVASQFGGVFEDVLNDVSHEAPAPEVKESFTPKNKKKREKKKKKEVVGVS